MTISVIGFLIILLTHSVSCYFTQTGRYEELQRLGNPCYPRDTCQSLNKSTDDHLWRNRTCECGEHCVRYKTCCIDSNYFGMEQFAQKRPEEVCQMVQTKDFMVLMVSTCLQEWNKSPIYRKCVHPENDLKDPLSEAPVISTASMTTYRNFFCALCNNDDDSALLWDIEVKMPNNLNLGRNAITPKDNIIERLEYNSAQNSWGFFYIDPQTRKQEFKNVQITFSLKEDLKKFVKPCHEQIISKCSPSYKSTRLLYKCQAYYSPVKGRRQGTEEFFNYRNIHCALCNGLRINLDDFFCLVKINLRKSVSLSFTKLLDVNRKDGDIVGKVSACKEGQMYDPFFKKCRTMACALPNHVVKNGACVKSD
ncbi:uncharacterized protein LOC129976607 isoform X1 [Argiope bruennichi]|uniref:uncharacterized protein LOC129976607 isoform X1 n=1 Tax=Argiope bruennichi TaxID=94029 RepID=UPI0024944196|nr:uncharacterized protein LOC129976607 isoform X1 [Argiope bruennichi]XP_055946229.1 uncharacterized protein LOC129976607 isoform X1 [Argiope bruennichi]